MDKCFCFSLSILSSTHFLFSNTWIMTPPRQEEDKKQVHKGREQLLLWSLMGVNILAATVATAFLMDENGPKILSSLPDLSSRQEFLLFGGAPAIFCHLLSGVLLSMYYQCSHTWRSIGSQRDVKHCICHKCFCCPSIGRIWSQENPVVPEIPFWELVSGSIYKHLEAFVNIWKHFEPF